MTYDKLEDWKPVKSFEPIIGLCAWRRFQRFCRDNFSEVIVGLDSIRIILKGWGSIVIHSSLDHDLMKTIEIPEDYRRFVNEGMSYFDSIRKIFGLDYHQYALRKANRIQVSIDTLNNPCADIFEIAGIIGCSLRNTLDIIKDFNNKYDKAS